MSAPLTMAIVFAVGVILGGAGIVSLSATGRRRRRDRTWPYKD